MKANAKYFKVTFLLNMILGLVAGGLFWLIRLIGSFQAVWGLPCIICTVIFMAIAAYINFFIVKRAKLKTVYFLYGTLINALFYAAIVFVLPFCFGLTIA